MVTRLDRNPKIDKVHKNALHGIHLYL